MGDKILRNESLRNNKNVINEEQESKTPLQKFQLTLLKIFLLLIATLFGIQLYNYYQQNKSQSIPEEMVVYLEERYGEEFVIESWSGGNFFNRDIHAYAYPVNQYDSEYIFQVDGYRDKDGKREYYDTYVQEKIKKVCKDYIEPIIGEYFDEYKFYIMVGSEGNNKNLPADIEIKELKESKLDEHFPMPSLHVYLPPSESQDEISTLIDTINESIYDGYIYVVWCYRDEVYDDITDDNRSVKDYSSGQDYESYSGR